MPLGDRSVQEISRVCGCLCVLNHHDRSIESWNVMQSCSRRKYNSRTFPPKGRRRYDIGRRTRPPFPLLRSKQNALRLITIAKKISTASKQSKASSFLGGILRVFPRGSNAKEK